MEFSDMPAMIIINLYRSVSRIPFVNPACPSIPPART